MKFLDSELLASVGGAYDQTRTTIQGRIAQKTVNGVPVLGPPITKFIDFQTDTAGVVMGTTMYVTPNGRMFIVGSIAAGAASAAILLYDFDLTTGAHSYVGRINVSLPANPAATTIAVRSLKAIDTGVTGWKIYLVTAASGTGVPLTHGGTYLANNIAKADFSQISPPTIPFATGNDQKAVYHLVESTTVAPASVTITVANPGKVQYVSHPFANNEQVLFTSGTVPTGLALNTTYFVRNAGINDFELSTTFGGPSIVTTGVAGTAVIHMVKTETASAGAIIDLATNRLYSHNGTAASHSYYVRSTSVAPSYTIQAAVNVTLASPGKVQYAAHPFQLNDPIIFTGGSAPGGLALNTVYYVRNITANDFEVSLTSGGASINTTTTGVVDVGRAFGESGDQWLYKTSTLPALAGTLLLTDSENKATPTAAPINGGILNGNSCAFLATTSNLYLGLLSELTKGANTWPSLTTSNILGALNQILTPTATNASWSDALDMSIFVCNTIKFVNKKVENNAIFAIYGQLGVKYYEATSYPSHELEFGAAPTNFSNQLGWLFVMGPSATVGQRGIIAMDLRSDCTSDFSYIVTKVLTLPQNSQIKTVKALIELANTSGNLDIYYRTSGFGTITGGWVQLTPDRDLSSLSVGTQIQFKITFNVQTTGETSPCQVANLLLGYDSGEELSDNWEYSYDDSSTGSPTRVGFRLKQTYSTGIPSTLRFRSYDLTGVLLISQSITTNPANFEYSTNNGTSWNALGVIPNTVGTLVRYTFTSPPGIDIRPSLQDD